MTRPALSVREIALRRGSFSLDPITFDVHPGEIVGLLGPNGSGKSTTFSILSGLQLPSAGQVSLGDVDVTRWPLWRRARAGIALLPQSPSLLPGLSVVENLTLVSSPAQAAAVLASDGLAHLASRPVAGLSGGERRRVEVLRLCVSGARVALLDEPFAGVDPIHVQAMQRRIRGLAEAGVAVLLTDHAVQAVLPLVDRALLIDAGAIIAHGTVSDIIANPSARTRWLGESGGVPVAGGGFTRPPGDL
jgi:lipopolysaccharide export system ATP-binding protein